MASTTEERKKLVLFTQTTKNRKCSETNMNTVGSMYVCGWGMGHGVLVGAEGSWAVANRESGGTIKRFS